MRDQLADWLFSRVENRRATQDLLSQQGGVLPRFPKHALNIHGIVKAWLGFAGQWALQEDGEINRLRYICCCTRHRLVEKDNLLSPARPEMDERSLKNTSTARAR
jgi:hypothetical protein